MFGTQDPTQGSPGGLMGLLNSPTGQGLLAAGLGAMGSRGSTMQAIGRGGLLGLSAMGQAQETQQNRLLANAKFQMEQAKFQNTQQMQQKMQDAMGSVFGGGARAIDGQAGQGASGAQASPVRAGGGLAGASIDQIAILKAYGGEDLTDQWKLAQQGGVQLDSNKYLRRPDGTMEYLPQMPNGMTYNPGSGQAGVIPGFAQGNAAIKGAETAAQEGAKYPFTAGLETHKQNTAAGLDAMQVVGPDGNTYFMPRSQVVGGAGGGGTGAGMPVQAGRNPVNVQADQELNKNWISGTFQPTLDAAQGARGTLASIQAVRNLDLTTGWGTDSMAKAANFLTGLGLASEDAQKLATNAQQFQSVAMDRLLKTLQSQSGPQTEGDAQRAGQTWVQLQNTPQANAFILDFAEAQAKMQARKAEFYQDALPIARRLGDLTEVDRKWKEYAGSVWADPVLQRWAKQKGQ